MAHYGSWWKVILCFRTALVNVLSIVYFFFFLSAEVSG